ncbi:DUF4232 domain-containing protein [Streptomyces sp. ME02-6991-2A]|uniref:DUF4232 domain-containing protein n=1 Tax=Streptomyces sp. ME02-6991-2A TaxID=3028677 RepID=UPI001008653C|nr:DUF4232 domain-containing protein [Streptomyces sp. ME02-6991-2A]MDX3377072.1 DUF4232 domain-containing protein [Streptomyces sp. ME02-6991-2A]
MFGHRNRRKALLASAALVGGALLMTACQDTDGSVDSGAAQSSSPSADAGSPSASEDAASDAPMDGPSDAASDAPTSGASNEPTASDEPTASPSAGSGSGGGSNGSGVGQVCGANDLSWSTRSESQAGGYILVMAKAKSGITCVLPAALPTVAFGSDGTEAGPVEQAVGKQITLSGGTVAYAGVNPRTTDTDGGKELDSIILAIGNDDPNPVSLKVGTITVDKPVVTNWHTAPKDAVPFS